MQAQGYVWHVNLRNPSYFVAGFKFIVAKVVTVRVGHFWINTATGFWLTKDARNSLDDE